MGRTSEETWKDRCLRAEAQLKALTTDLHEQAVKDKEKDTKKLEIVVQKVHLDPSVGEHVASELCEHVTEAMIVGQFAKSKHDPRAYARSKKKDPDVAQQKWEMKQMFTMAFIVCLMQRMKSIHTTPTMTVMLSCCAYFWHVPRKFWAMLTSVKILMGYKWTHQFLLQAARSELPKAFNASPTVCFGCYDNCGYYIHHATERSDGGNQYYDTVNWYTQDVHEDLVTSDPIGLVPARLREEIGHLCVPNVDHHTQLLEFASMYIGGMRYNTISDYPEDPDHSGKRSEVTIGIPIIEMDTASYVDNAVMVWFIEGEVRRKFPNCEYIIIIGDEQTYDRMIKMKSARAAMFEWLIPMPGEFHVIGHICHCLYRLYWDDLIDPCCRILQREFITKDWGMTKFNAHNDLLLVVIAAIHKWFEHCFGEDCLQDPDSIREECYQNFTTTLLLDFMVFDGMPYAALRRLLHKSACPARRKIIDLYYGYYQSRFRSVNKFLYSMLCVHYLYIKANCCPAIWNVWSHMYTQSCLGIPGRDTTTDGFMEKINRYAKRLLNGHITPNRVQTIVPLLNVLLRLIERWTHFMSSNHGGRYVYPGDVSPDADTEKIFKFLCNQHANDLPQAIFPAFQNVFTNKVASGTRNVNRYVSQFNRDWAEYQTRRHLAIRF
jgi:hypothetical protein